MRARWTGSARYFPDLGRIVNSGDIVDDIPKRDVEQSPFWAKVVEPRPRRPKNAKNAPAAKTKVAKKTAAKPAAKKTEELTDAN